MTILPVLDLLRGRIVRGVGGRRDEYQPVLSTLVNTADPLAVANAFRTYFGFSELYLADLDAICKQKPSNDIYEKLHAAGFRLWIDAGIQSANDATFAALVDSEIHNIIVGL